MVMIPVGNRTKHSFKLWCFAETYIRMIITTVVIVFAQDIISTDALRMMAILFFIWSYRPIYFSFKSLYSSWKWAKHEAIEEELSQNSGSASTGGKK